MKQPYPVAKEGLVYIIVLALITLAFFLWSPWLGLLPGILMLFVAFFFRNPTRVIPEDKDALVAPADGVILTIERVHEDRFLRTEAVRVSIFLSVFNVHLNRTPINGTVKYRSYRPGKFLPAFKGHASEINEKSFVGIENNRLKIMVTQVTGFIARRIVCAVATGDRVERGDIFGLIKFGSCTEVFVPADKVEILVKKGDKVVGGETIIGRIKS